MPTPPSLPFDLRAFSEDPELQDAFYRENVQGTVSSQWAFLCSASASSAWQAAQALARLYNLSVQWIEEGRAAGEIEMLITFNYRISASGPLLSSVVLPVVAIESFTRLIAEVHLAEATSTDAAFLLALEEFDARPLLGRIHEATRLIGCRKLSQLLANELSALVSFRNEIMHPIPVINGPDGVRVAHKRGRAQLVALRPTAPTDYPNLAASALPLSLFHTLRAISAHDALIQHVLDTGPTVFLDRFANRVKDTMMPIRSLGAQEWSKLPRILEAWVKVIEWLEAIPNKERERFYGDLRRRLELKLTS